MGSWLASVLSRSTLTFYSSLMVIAATPAIAHFLPRLFFFYLAEGTWFAGLFLFLFCFALPMRWSGVLKEICITDTPMKAEYLRNALVVHYG